MAITTLNSVKQFIFIMVKCGVFFEVRTELLNIIWTSFGFKWLKVGDGDYFPKHLNHFHWNYLKLIITNLNNYANNYFWVEFHYLK
jgi:hypothetical protein